MARRLFLSLPRRRAPGPPPAPPAEPFSPVGNPSQMRRERADLLRRRELGIRDVGGLMLEMARRDRFRPELLLAKADEVLAVEQRINELESLLSASRAAGRRLHRVPRCRCGAPIPPGVHFCSHCGRPSPGGSPVVACTHCGQPLPAEANFCAACGNPVAVEDFPETDLDATMARASEARSGD